MWITTSDPHRKRIFRVEKKVGKNGKVRIHFPEKNPRKNLSSDLSTKNPRNSTKG